MDNTLLRQGISAVGAPSEDVARDLSSSRLNIMVKAASAQLHVVLAQILRYLN